MKPRVAPAVLTTLFLLPSALLSQERLLQQCATIGSDPAPRFCNMVVEAIEIAQPRIGLAVVGGNPLTGSASTLGMRIGNVPRFAAEARITSARANLPPIKRIGSSNDIEALIPSLNLDATIGIFDGFSILPTVGGFASLDLLASVGFVPLPEDDGFNGSTSSWGLGARLGLMRESFTAPGVSVSALYRQVGDAKFGDRNLQTEQSYFTLSDLSVLSLRGVIGKRLLFLGASAGIGWDRFTSDAAMGVANPSQTGAARFEFTENDFQTSRIVYFGALQYTLLVLSINLEGGFQSGGDSFIAALPAGQTSSAQNKAFFASLAIRLTI